MSTQHMNKTHLQINNTLIRSTSTKHLYQTHEKKNSYTDTHTQNTYIQFMHKTHPQDVHNTHNKKSR